MDSISGWLKRGPSEAGTNKPFKAPTNEVSIVLLLFYSIPMIFEKKIMIFEKALLPGEKALLPNALF